MGQPGGKPGRKPKGKDKSIHRGIYLPPELDNFVLEITKQQGGEGGKEISYSGMVCQIIQEWREFNKDGVQ